LIIFTKGYGFKLGMRLSLWLSINNDQQMSVLAKIGQKMLILSFNDQQVHYLD